MSNTNYVAAIVKILEVPKKKVIKNNISVTKFRCQLPQIRQTRVVTLTCWGKLSEDILTYYSINDYILVEGYLSLFSDLNSKLEKQKSKKVQITVRKVYPFLLNSSKLLNKF